MEEPAEELRFESVIDDLEIANFLLMVESNNEILEGVQHQDHPFNTLPRSVPTPKKTSKRSKHRSLKKKKKIKKPPKPYYIPVNSMPRILKRDVRRDFGKMITNVYNSGDESLIRHFFGQFCIPNFEFIVFSCNSNTAKPDIRFVTGLKTAVQRTINTLSGFPDLIFQLEKAQIVRRFDCTGSLLQLQMKVAYTPLFMEELGDVVDSSSEFVQLHHKLVHFYGSLGSKDGKAKDPNMSYIIPNISMLCTGNPTELVEAANHLLRSHPDALQPCLVCQTTRNKYLESPISYNGMMNIKVLVDDVNRICRMEFHMC